METRSNPKSRGSPEERSCGSCDARLKEGEEIIKCEICEYNFHTQCEGVKKATYKFMMESLREEDFSVHWYCNGCNRGCGKILKMMTCIEVRQQKVEQELKVLKSEVTKLEKEATKRVGDVMEVVGQKMGELEDSMTQQIQGLGQKTSKQVENEINEAIDRHQRKKRIVITDLARAGEPEEEVNRKVANLLRKLDVNPERDIVGIQQLRETRHISVELKQVAQKNEILQKSNKLRDLEEYKEVYVRPDLTYNQRKEGFRLRAEIRERTKKGEKTCGFSGGK